MSFSTCLLKSRSTSLDFVISPNPSSLHCLWSTSFAFGNFHIPIPLVLLRVPQPNTEQLSPGMTIVDQLTANLAAKTRIFDSNFDFYDSRRHLDFTVVHFRDHVTELKPKQRDHPLKFAGFHNHSPLLTMLPLINYKNNTATNETFPPVQIVFDAVFYTLSRGFALPVFYVFLNMLLFLNCEVEKFNEELLKCDYRREDQAKKRAKEIKNLIMDTERAFRFFLVLSIATLLLASALEIFSIVEKSETVIIANRTIHCLPASATNSLQTLPFAQENIKAFPHRLAGKRSFPYLLVVIPPGNNSFGVTGANGFFDRISGWTKTVIEQYKLKTQEIVVTAVLDVTQNMVLYAFPLYKMTALKSCLKTVQATVEDSDYGDQDSNMKIFDTRQDREDFKTYFRDTCTSGIRVLGKEVSFLWTLVLTFFGPFAVVVVNLMFKRIHVESPLE